MLQHFISGSLYREDIYCVFDGMNISVSRRIEYRAGKMLIVFVQDTIAMEVSA